MTVVFMVPGHTSRSPQMIERIVAAWPESDPRDSTGQLDPITTELRRAA